MDKYRTIDIEAELSDILNKEEMIASFDFSLPSPAGESIDGLCTISAPKPETSAISYITLVFVIDLPGPDSWQLVGGAMKGIDWEKFCSLGSGITSVLPNPARPSRSNYIQEVSLYLAKNERPGKDYCSDVLIPLIAAVTGIQNGTITFWGESG